MEGLSYLIKRTPEGLSRRIKHTLKGPFPLTKCNPEGLSFSLKSIRGYQLIPLARFGPFQTPPPPPLLVNVKI